MLYRVKFSVFLPRFRFPFPKRRGGVADENIREKITKTATKRLFSRIYDDKVLETSEIKFRICFDALYSPQKKFKKSPISDRTGACF